MHDARTWQGPCLGVQRQQAVEQSAAPVSRCRMHHQAGWLQDDPQVFITIHAVQGHVLGGVGQAFFGRAQGHLQGDSSADPGRGLDQGLALRIGDIALDDQVLQMTARELAQQTGQRFVQPFTMQNGRHLQNAAFDLLILFQIGVDQRSIYDR